MCRATTCNVFISVLLMYGLFLFMIELAAIFCINFGRSKLENRETRAQGLPPPYNLTWVHIILLSKVGSAHSPIQPLINFIGFFQ